MLWFGQLYLAFPGDLAYAYNNIQHIRQIHFLARHLIPTKFTHELHHYTIYNI